MIDHAQLYFPNGCSQCNSRVKFIKEQFLYVCDHCDAKALAHRDQSDFNRKYEPTGYMGDHETVFLRERLVEVFNSFYRETLFIKGNREMITTTPVNVVYKDHIVSVVVGDNIDYGIVDKNDKSKVHLVDTNIILEDVPEIKKASNKVKAYIWLAKQLNKDLQDTKIGFLSKQELKEAYDQVSKALDKARLKSILPTNG